MKNQRSLVTLFAIMLLLVTTTQAQRWGSGPAISGEGEVVSQEISLDDFHSIGLGIVAEVKLYKGAQRVEIAAQKNIIDNIERKVKDGSWNIKYDKRVKNAKDVVITIWMPEVKELSIGGSGSIHTMEAFTGMGRLEFNIGGSGDIEFAGTAEAVEISIAGSGEVKAAKLAAKECEVSIAGSGDAEIEVNGPMDVSIAGSGSVRYHGDARVSSSVAGSGRVKRM